MSDPRTPPFALVPSARFSVPREHDGLAPVENLLGPGDPLRTGASSSPGARNGLICSQAGPSRTIVPNGAGSTRGCPVSLR